MRWNSRMLLPGPFKADLMQKWHDDGYFSPELLMKRTHIDTEWTTLGDLSRRSGGGKIFLSPARSSSFSVRAESPLQGLTIPPEQKGSKAPFQPVPSQSFRPSGLDSYLGTPSSLTDTPSPVFQVDSYGAAEPPAFGVGSPAGSFSSDPVIGSRAAGFPPIPESPTTFVNVRRGSMLNDQLVEQPLTGVSPFGNHTSTRSSSIDSFGLGVNTYSPGPSSWPPPPNNQNAPGFETRPESLGMYSFPTPGSNTGSVPLSQGLGFGNRHGQVSPMETGGPGFGLYATADYGSGEPKAHREPPAPSRSMMDGQDPGLEFNDSYATVVVGNATLAPPTTSQPFTSSPTIQYTAPQVEKPASVEQPRVNTIPQVAQ
jgi:PERQ amino acid-rich with GYF domain-containing protein